MTACGVPWPVCPTCLGEGLWGSAGRWRCPRCGGEWAEADPLPRPCDRGPGRHRRGWNGAAHVRLARGRTVVFVIEGREFRIDYPSEEAIERVKQLTATRLARGAARTPWGAPRLLLDCAGEEHAEPERMQVAG